jgi:hypothetical protein
MKDMPVKFWRVTVLRVGDKALLFLILIRVILIFKSKK